MSKVSKLKKLGIMLIVSGMLMSMLTACGGSKTDSAAADSSSAAAGDDKTITVGRYPDSAR